MNLKKLAAAGMLLAACCAGQTTFAVASIRPSHSKGGAGLSTLPGTLTIRNIPLKTIIATAFGVPGYRISGPAWLGKTRFDIVAKTEAPVAGDEEMWPLLQALLAERFHWTMHRETKELAGFVLTVAKNGPKLEAAGDGAADLSFKKANKAKGTSIEAARLTMPQFAEVLSRKLGRPVTDKTAVAGAYHVRLKWAPLDDASKPGKGGKAKPGRDLPSLFTVIRDQMGLRLDAGKTLGEMIVIDRIEQTPIEN